MTRTAGSASTELVLLAPLLLILIGLVVVTGRLGETGQAVVHATQQAARAASLRDQPDAARSDAQQAAAANLAALGVVCTDLAVSVDTSSLHPGGEVAVTVSCTTDLSTVAFSGLPGRRTFTSDAVEAVDTYRGDG